MSIPVTCTSCQYQFAVPAEFAGKRGKCPKCGAIIVAPASEPASAPVASTPRPAAPPARPKAAAALPPVAAAPVPSAPARPAPRPLPSAPAPRARDTVRPADTLTTDGSINFAVTPTAHTQAAPSSSAATRRPSRKAANTGMFIALGVGGGVLVLALIVGGVFALSGSGATETSAAKKATAKDSIAAGKKGRRAAVEDDDVGLLDRRRGPVEIVAAKPREARSLSEVKDGVVKIETPGIGGMSLGTGFIINEKGWIATNCHVVDGATDQTRVIIQNNSYKVAGLVIKAPEHDMAIIKLAEQPFQLTVLDISYSQHPELASNVIAIGYPDDVFNITKGIVSNVTTTDGLSNNRQKAFVLQAMQGANNHLWIQHGAKISPGNSGGPLLNEDYQVIGINTWVSANIDVGYAGHINHLRDLIAKASDTVTPFPKGVGVEIADADAMINTVPTAARVNQLIAFCEKFQWKPTTLDEFDAMAELAKLITMVRLAPSSSVPDYVELKKASDQAVELLSQLSWDADQVKKVNGFAADATNKPMHGIVFVATMVEPNASFGDNVKADRLKLEGNDRHVIVKGPANRPLALKDARLLVIGINMPTLVLETEEANAQRVIVPGYSKELK